MSMLISLSHTLMPFLNNSYAMRTLKMDFQCAYAFVKSKRPIIMPNEGFRRQLELFGEMGCTVDLNHEKYLGLLPELEQEKSSKR